LKKIFVLLIYISIITTICAQKLQSDNTPIIESQSFTINDTLNFSYSQFVNNFIFAEVGGNGVLLSINYEHLLNEKVGIRIGAGTAGYSGLTFPIMLNYYFFEKPKLELGIGLLSISKMMSNDLLGEESTLISFTIGLKSYKANGGFLFRLSFTPFYNLSNNKIIFYGGLSAGWAFN
jgi:hypothetical protein